MVNRIKSAPNPTINDLHKLDSNSSNKKEMFDIKEEENEQDTNEIKKENSKEEAKNEEAKTEEAKIEEAKTEEAKIEEAKTEEAKAEESKVEESKAEESKVEESKTEESKTETINESESISKIEAGNSKIFESDTKPKIDSILQSGGTPDVRPGEQNITNSSFKKDITNFVDLLQSKDQNSNNESPQQKEEEPKSPKSFVQNEEAEGNVKEFDPNESVSSQKSNDDEDDKSGDERSSSSENEFFEQTIIDQLDDNLIEQSLNETGDKTLLNDINELHNIGPRQKRGLVLIKKKLERHIKTFNKIFYSSVFPTLTKKVQKIMKEKFDTYVNISNQYQEQINEAEDQEDAEAIIEGINDECRNEADNNDDKYNAKVEKAENDFKTQGFKENNDVILLQEKFMGEICGEIFDLWFR